MQESYLVYRISSLQTIFQNRSWEIYLPPFFMRSSAIAEKKTSSTSSKDVIVCLFIVSMEIIE